MNLTFDEGGKRYIVVCTQEVANRGTIKTCLVGKGDFATEREYDNAYSQFGRDGKLSAFSINCERPVRYTLGEARKKTRMLRGDSYSLGYFCAGEFMGTFLSMEALKPLLVKFQDRAKDQGWKKGSKKYNDMLTEFFVGAAALNDVYHATATQTACPPVIIFGIMRGDLEWEIEH